MPLFSYALVKHIVELFQVVYMITETELNIICI